MATREELDKRIADLEAALKTERDRADAEHKRAEKERSRADAAVKAANDRWVTFFRRTSKLPCSDYYRLYFLGDG